MMDERLPEGWVWARIGDIADVIGGSTPLRSETHYYGGNIVWLTPTEIPKETVSFIFDSKEKLTKEGFEASGVRWIPAGSVLLTSRASIGYVAIAGIPLTTNQGFASFVLSKGINSIYFGWWLKSQKAAFENIAGGTTFKEISKATLKDLFIPLAPTNEQARIVAAIEQQFAHLDRAVASLKSAQAKIPQYRASLLKSAVEGELTREWRAAHPAEESGADLLKRILAERRARWEEAQLAKMHARGETPWNDEWKKAYKEPQGPDVEKLPDLPEGWCWATVEQAGDATEQVVLTGPFGSSLGREDFRDTGIPLLTIGCLTEQGLSMEKAFYISEQKASELERYRVRVGDILFSRMASVGRADIVSRAFEGAVINYHLMRLRLSERAVNPLYFISFVRGARTVTDYIREVNHGMTRDGINTDQLLNLPVAVPPLAEQAQIVAEVEARLSEIAKMEEVIEHSLRRAELERQSILREAFAGRLVEQNPEDEPASVLLERIREERRRREALEKERRKGERTMRKGEFVYKSTEAKLYHTLAEARAPMEPGELFRQTGFKIDTEMDEPEPAEQFFTGVDYLASAGAIEEERPDNRTVLLKTTNLPEEQVQALLESAEQRVANQSPQPEQADLWNQ
jgi:type I restriction enzyme S subunit